MPRHSTAAASQIGPRSARCVADAGQNHAEETEQCEVIGVDPGRHAVRQPDETFFSRKLEQKNALLLDAPQI